MKTLIVLTLVMVFGASVLLDNVRRQIPLKELRRRVRSGKDRRSAAIYKMNAYGQSLRLLLWLSGSLAAAGLIWMATEVGWWLVVAVMLLLGWLIWKDYTNVKTSVWQWRLAGFLAPSVAGLLSILQPVLGRFGVRLQTRRLFSYHSQVYEKEDLLELLHTQPTQAGNRVSEPELKIATGALTFSDKTVREVMTPRRVVKTVLVSDSIGPHLMDELHASGFSRFPVIREPTKSAHLEIIGVLHLRDVINHSGKGRVRDIMEHKVHFINENQSLRDALAAYIKTEHHLLVVVNSFEEVVGVITLEDVLEQILGEKIIDEFDRHDDMRAVAGAEAAKDQSKHPAAKVVE